MLRNRANDIALGEHAGRGITFGSDDVLDHERTDIAGAHQLRGNGDSFVHANRHDARSFLAQDVSDLHRNLLGQRLNVLPESILVYNMPTVNVVFRTFGALESGSIVDVREPSGGKFRPGNCSEG